VAAEEGRTSQLDNAPEEILDPNRPIIDPHHHLWDHPNDRYLLPEFLADLNAGHRIDKTVYVQSGAMLRADGPPELRSLGETEFANGIAAMSASDTYGKCRVAAAIISSVDFRLKARAGEVLKAHVAAAGGRLRGIRTNFPADKNLNMPGIVPADLLANADYREGFAQLERLGLLSEVWCLFTQLPMVAGLAEAFPKTPIVINHLGTPVLTGFYSTRGALPTAHGARTPCLRWEGWA
jgi:predicted TIM-barrel fold metal-dependent hydrolase